MKQESLFENKQPLARNTDPVTSALAGQAITEDGTRDVHKSKVLKALKEEPLSVTSRELSVRMDMDRHEVARRLSDLKVDGLVCQAGKRVCTASKKRLQCVTWKAVNHAK
jgi:predicted HTH transcriptional regulator